MEIKLKDTTIKINFLNRSITIEDWIRIDENTKICYPKKIKYGIFSFLKVLYLLLIKKHYYEFLFFNLMDKVIL
ncbi:MAG: hypothetical protein QXO95_03920 [Candidatus Aenigmatarchaeota archaeon]